MNEEIERLKAILQRAKVISVITGAGISTPSGIPDIRSATGAMHDRRLLERYHHSYEEIVSHSFFLHHPDEFFRYYKEQMIFQKARPNAAHLFLKDLAKVKDVTIITQNIDGLHSLAGSKKVIEFHGSVQRNHCLKCHAAYGLEEVLRQDGAPHCPLCGGLIKPDVVLFEEPIDSDAIEDSLQALDRSDTLLIIGSSLKVFPAAGLPAYFHGRDLVIINRDPTHLDDRASLTIHADVSKILAEIDVQSLA